MPEFRRCGPACAHACCRRPLHSGQRAVGLTGPMPCSISDRLGFRVRSETADIAIELSLQPWKAFRPDGVIMFSDILTPLPALGIEFDVVPKMGPRIEVPVRRWGLPRRW